MKDNVKIFEIRWGDLDPNRHVANSTYCEFMNDTRMTYLNRKGFGQAKFAEQNFGPVTFKEEYHYLKELFAGETVYVDVELLGHTEDQRIFKFCHCLYKADGELAMYSELIFGWFSLSERKLTHPPQELADILLAMPHAEKFHLIPKEEIRSDKPPFGKKLVIE